MVAYQGEVNFEHAGSGGMSRLVKKAVSGEGTDLMKVSGSGEVFLADLGQDIQLLKLDDESITANGANVLAFDAGIDWDIRRVEGVSAALGGGLYNMELQGSGYVALVSDGPPLLLELDGSTPTFADPQAAITWSRWTFRSFEFCSAKGWSDFVSWNSASVLCMGGTVGNRPFSRYARLACTGAPS
jgi:uncharacterized protein (AIM24 family)